MIDGETRPALDVDLPVCVVGAGFAGLAVAYELRARDIPFTCMDRGKGVGGLWCHTESTTTPSYASLHMNTSRHLTGFARFPMPETYPTYPRHDQVAAYLDAFARTGGFLENIELNTEVECVRPARNGTWTVTSRDRGGMVRSRRFSQLVMASGHHWEPRLPEPPIRGCDSFPGVAIHSFEYHDAVGYTGKRALVLGLGNSASDIAVAVSHVAETTVLSIRHGAHVVPKQLMGIPVDEIGRRWWWRCLPLRAQRRLLGTLLWVTRGSLIAHGLPEPAARILSTPLTVSDELLSRIDHGAVRIKPAIDHVDRSTVQFADGTREDFDAVVYCTGYTMSAPVVPADALFAADGRVALYLRVVAPTYPGLYFAGLVRGFIRPNGALTRVLEAQATWIADLIGGAAARPSVEVMTGEISAHLRRTGRHHGSSAADSLFVDVPHYLRALRREQEEGRQRIQRCARRA